MEGFDIVFLSPRPRFVATQLVHGLIGIYGQYLAEFCPFCRSLPESLRGFKLIRAEAVVLNQVGEGQVQSSSQVDASNGF